MKELDQKTIDGLLVEIGTAEKRRLHSEKIRTSWSIHGCQMARELSDIIDEAVLHIIEEMEVPEEVTIIGVWATGRQEATPWSDLDIIWYVPDSEGFEREFAEPYRKNMWKVLSALNLKGEPTVWVPGDFMKSDLVTIASMNLDARLLYGGTTLTLQKIQQKVQAVCKPFFIASRHEEILKNFQYGNTEWSEFKVDFDIKEDRGGLRHLQHILWLLAAVEGTGLQSMYTEVQRKDPEVYNALDLMLHIRSWLHLKKLWTKDKKIDLLKGNFWPELKSQFWDDIIERIQTSRRAIIRYERTRILWEKKKGIKVGNGIKYGLLGLEIDKDSWLPKKDLVIQLLIDAQQTWCDISPLEFSRLEKEARKYMTEPHEKYAQLITETGDFAETVRRLRSLGIVDQIFPGYNILENQTYNANHRHAHITRVGRVLGRLENLENIIRGDLKDIYDSLSMEQQAWIRIALVCKDIPTFAEITHADYFERLKKNHPWLPEWIEIAEHLVRKHRILFDCSRMDDWYDERELRRIAGQTETPEKLNALLIYTCAVLDYGKPEYYHKSLWDKTFDLYYALREEMEWETPEKQQAKMEMILTRTWRLSPEQNDILSTAQETFLRSRYVSNSDSLGKTMRYLEWVQDTGEPQIKVVRNQEGSIRIIVSCQYTTEVTALIMGTCFQNNITINDAEIHTFWTEHPLLAVLFLEAGFNIPNLTPLWQDDTVNKLEKNLQENMKKWDISEVDYRDILQKSAPTYLLETTNETGNYKFIVTAGNDTPGFLYALTKMIAEAHVNILSTNIYTHPRRNDLPPYIEDTFILDPKNIDQLQKSLKKLTYSSPDNSMPQ